MARIQKKTLQEIKVTFTLEERPLTFAQKEAGKRLFSSLIERAQAQLKEDIAIEEKTGRSAQVGRRKPPPALKDEQIKS
jgi:hypothetical protein